MCVELNIAGVCIPPTAELHWHLRSCLWHAQAAGSTPPRAPRLFCPSPASFPPALRLAGHCSVYPSPISSSAPSLASSLLSGSSTQWHTARSYSGVQRKRRKHSFSCGGAKRAARAIANSGHPHHPRSSGAASTALAQQGLQDAELLGSFPGQASPAYFWEAGSCLLRARLSRTRAPAPPPPPTTRSPVPCSRCIPAVPGVLGLWVTGGELTPLWACRAEWEPPAKSPGPAETLGFVSGRVPHCCP